MNRELTGGRPPCCQAQLSGLHQASDLRYQLWSMLNRFQTRTRSVCCYNLRKRRIASSDKCSYHISHEENGIRHQGHRYLRNNTDKTLHNGFMPVKTFGDDSFLQLLVSTGWLRDLMMWR